MKNIPIDEEYPAKYDRLLCGGIWCIVQLDYEVEGDNNFGIEDIDGNPLCSKQKKQKDISPISIRKLTPIQMPHVDLDELKKGRKAFPRKNGSMYCCAPLAWTGSTDLPRKVAALAAYGTAGGEQLQSL